MKLLLSASCCAFAIIAGFALTPGAAPAYQVGETPTPVRGVHGKAGPIRLARFSYVQGAVTWRANEDDAWSSALINLPLRQGAQISVASGGRAEIQFDDGSLLRLGGGAVSTLKTLYSDSGGEFTEIQLDQGVSELALHGTQSVFQADTPFVSVKSEGPSKVRIGVDSSVEIAVRLGEATVEGESAQKTLRRGDYVNVTDTDASCTVRLLPDTDSWDRFNDDRDRALGSADPHLPPDIALVAGNLAAYGDWHTDLRYGQVWCPRVSETGWRPYQHGQWVWVEPFGWTWVSGEAWGWAPYHYGAWVSEPYGWSWVPGPAQQYWCPSVVHFSEYDGEVAWVPLAPAEVHYPVYLAHCYDGGGDWSELFSIGGAAVYYPEGASACDPRPFHNEIVNWGSGTDTNLRDPTHRGFRPVTVNHNIYVHRGTFIPINAGTASGVTTATVAEFGGKGRYHPVARGGDFFTKGRAVGAPTAGTEPVAGPPAVHPAPVAPASSGASLPESFPSAPMPQRPVFRAPLPVDAARPASPVRVSEPATIRPKAPLPARPNPIVPRPDSPVQPRPLPVPAPNASQDTPEPVRLPSRIIIRIPRPVEQSRPLERAPVEERHAEERAPVEEKPAARTPAEQKHVEEKHVEEKHVEQRQVERAPVEEKKADSNKKADDDKKADADKTQRRGR